MQRKNGRSRLNPITPPVLNTDYIRVLLAYRRLTSAEIGRRAGVGEVQVRKAINNLEPISPETKRRVLRVLTRALRRRADLLCVGRLAA